jgi:hypothetical protein
MPRMTVDEAHDEAAYDEVRAAVARYGLPVVDAELAALVRARNAMRALATLVATVDAARAVEPVLDFSPAANTDPPGSITPARRVPRSRRS